MNSNRNEGWRMRTSTPCKGRKWIMSVFVCFMHCSKYAIDCPPPPPDESKAQGEDRGGRQPPSLSSWASPSHRANKGHHGLSIRRRKADVLLESGLVVDFDRAARLVVLGQDFCQPASTSVQAG